MLPPIQATRTAAGPVEAALPNNGMVVVEMQGDERVTVASRWKLNDPARAGI